MARGRQFLAARVYDRAESYLSSTIIKSDRSNRTPAWLQAVVHIPPAEVLTRPYPIQHTPPRDRALKPGRQPRNLFRPTKIVHPEDQLRQEFYRDHPWELARPKLVLELDGQDARYRDWSKGLRQPGMALSGESVVQRQLWLMEAKGMSKQQAYDVARKEFYKLRQQEEIERRIAVEEARHYGAYFGKTNLQVGMELEDQVYEHWKKWATDQIAKLEAERSAAYVNVVDVEEDSKGDLDDAEVV
ncbi:mitochondrial ribosomal protein S25 [Achaetomium macrosporum]|uniref:37S ribosomal protein S25, mitochondrial n=1 Tax=Achaetomium macrosporum TaxID=79813 RepID=A0AAN7CHH6_9PEZI|nr:mitochondrial ribosomal protein S25 [Achaetomium macrosporum]